MDTSGPSRPAALSRYLRTGDDADLRRRRAVLALSLVGAAVGQVVTAYQVGLLRHLPDSPGPFASARVDASDYAYRLGGPDGPVMVVTYAVTAVLAALGGEDRPRHRPVLPLLMGAKVVVDVVSDLVLARAEWQENRALCAYCQVATLVSVASVPLALPEARRALARLRGRAA